MINTEELTISAINAALSAGEILRKGFNTHFTINKKEGRHNLVTEYDLLSEKHIIEQIKGKYPSHNILSEEAGFIGNDSSEIQWIIDPIDGTVNFAHGIPAFAVSIAAKQEDTIILGVTYQPITNELFVAQKNKGAFLNGKQFFVSQVKDLNEAVIGTGFPYNLNENPGNCLERFLHMAKIGMPIRRMGSATIDLAYLACSRLDGFWEINLGPWDCAAGLLFIEEAKGCVTTWDGKPFEIKEKNQILASNGYLHEQLLKEFSK
jgi:myo-inositol-1(or 4)-monophosphatase